MKTSVQLIEEILRAKMALHLLLVAQRNEGKTDIGGGSIDKLLEEVDAGLLRYGRMLVLYKNEAAAEVMEAETLSQASENLQQQDKDNCGRAEHEHDEDR